MGLKLSNNAVSRLSSGITTASTSISLVSGDGALFPTLGAGDYFPATLVKADGSYEIVKVTARSTDVLTVIRAQENSTAKSFSAGDRIELRLTAAIIEALDTGKLSNSGGTLTGDLTMGVGTKIVMEGTTADANETTIDPGNPTADRTLTLPDKSGTLATTDDVNTALPKAGGTMTGNLIMGAGTKIVMEGTTDDAFEMTIDPGNPTADRTITLPDRSGIAMLMDSLTGAAKMPVGTTAQRPSGAIGDFRMNSTTGEPEWYDTATSSWVRFSGTAYAIEYLIVGGGGGGGGSASGYTAGGGGGAGGYRSSVAGESSGGGSSAESSLFVSSGASLTVTVGAGGSGAVGVGAGSSGNNSVFGSITSIGGGRGGTAAPSSTQAASGGSGGGAQWYGAATVGSGTSGQGYSGGASNTASNGGSGGGGGGGAGAVGAAGTSGSGGSGGTGVSSSITGSAVTRAGGGGGGIWLNAGTTGTGGSGGGGDGGVRTGGNGVAGTANTGGGGGGGSANNAGDVNGGNGGSGTVIVRYNGGQRGTGGTVTSSGGYTIHTFTSSGTFTA